MINSVVNGQEECVDLHIYDLVKAFDALWVAELFEQLVGYTACPGQG